MPGGHPGRVPGDLGDVDLARPQPALQSFDRVVLVDGGAERDKLGNAQVERRGVQAGSSRESPTWHRRHDQ
jgi:hypothetical protein